MTLDQIAFYFFATLAVLGAILTVTVRNVVHSAIFLITSLLATAGIFLTLKAQFVFAVQIILYVGGIMVLFLFVVMLVNLDVSIKQAQFSRQWQVALVTAIVLMAELGYGIYRGHQGFTLGQAAAAPVAVGNTQAVALALYRDYMLPVEIASILLLVAMVGAVIMAKRKME